MSVYENIGAAIGNTPLIRLQRLAQSVSARLYGKCEFMNPGGSVKDRIGFHMVAKAESAGLLKTGGTIVEATAGNTGMGLAMAAVSRGYRLIAVMTTKMSHEKVDLLRTLGAEVVICPYEVPYGSPEHFLSRARSLAEAIPGAWYADQFSNPYNVEAHFLTTGPEIWAQTEGAIDAVVAGMGTGGTLTGVGRFLKEQRASVEVILADPQGSVLKSAKDGTVQLALPYRVEGIGGDFVPKNADLSIVNEAISVTDAESVKMAMHAFRSEALFVGASSGAILHAAVSYCKRIENAGKTVVAILPDGGRSYLSTIYNEKWRKLSGLDIASPEM